MPQNAREWDALTYHRVSEPQFAWGLAVLQRLPLRGDETVLDAGCGTGRLTRVLQGRLPRGRVIAVDHSRNMLAQAAAHVADAQDRVQWLEADLATLELPAPVDAIFSAATFHWVPDHPALFRSLYRALRPGGRLVAQCGGVGNLTRVRARASRLMEEPALAPCFEGWTEAWNYASAEETTRRLTEAGFEQVRVWLEDAPTPFADADAFKAFCRGVVLRLHCARLPEGPLREGFLQRIAGEAALDSPPFTLDYKRLNLEAVRPEGA